MIQKYLKDQGPPVCVCVCVCVHAQLYPTVFNPMGCGLPGPSVHEVFQARTLEWAGHPLLNAVKKQEQLGD